MTNRTWEKGLEACTQPQCRLRDENLDPDFIADLIVRLMAGEDVDAANLISPEERITYYDRCRQCLLDVVRAKGPLKTVEELRQFEEGRQANRRQRRARQRAST